MTSEVSCLAYLPLWWEGRSRDCSQAWFLSKKEAGKMFWNETEIGTTDSLIASECTNELSLQSYTYLPSNSETRAAHLSGSCNKLFKCKLFTAAACCSSFFHSIDSLITSNQKIGMWCMRSMSTYKIARMINLQCEQKRYRRCHIIKIALTWHLCFSWLFLWWILSAVVTGAFLTESSIIRLIVECYFAWKWVESCLRKWDESEWSWICLLLRRSRSWI